MSCKISRALGPRMFQPPNLQGFRILRFEPRLWPIKGPRLVILTKAEALICGNEGSVSDVYDSWFRLVRCHAVRQSGHSWLRCDQNSAVTTARCPPVAYGEERIGRFLFWRTRNRYTMQGALKWAFFGPTSFIPCSAQRH